MNAQPELLSFDDAAERVPGLAEQFMGGYDTVLLVDGDLTITGDLTEHTEVTGLRGDVLLVTGDLTVSGRIALYEPTPALLVRGHTTAETLEGGDCEIYLGDATITHLVYGEYNHGVLEACTVTVPWLIDSDHDTRIEVPGATVIDNFGNTMLADPDHTPDSIVAAFVPEVVDVEELCVDVPAFLDRLRAGLPVLRG